MKASRVYIKKKKKSLTYTFLFIITIVVYTYIHIYTQVYTCINMGFFFLTKTNQPIIKRRRRRRRSGFDRDAMAEHQYTLTNKYIYKYITRYYYYYVLTSRNGFRKKQQTTHVDAYLYGPINLSETDRVVCSSTRICRCKRVSGLSGDGWPTGGVSRLNSTRFTGKTITVINAHR